MVIKTISILRLRQTVLFAGKSDTIINQIILCTQNSGILALRRANLNNIWKVITVLTKREGMYTLMTTVHGGYSKLTTVCVYEPVRRLRKCSKVYFASIVNKFFFSLRWIRPAFSGLKCLRQTRKTWKWHENLNDGNPANFPKTLTPGIPLEEVQVPFPIISYQPYYNNYN